MTVLFIGISVMMVLLFGGLWIGFAMGTAGFLALGGAMGLGQAFFLSAIRSWDINTGFVLTAFPLFVFMGELLFYAGFAERIYTASAKVAQGLPGGLIQTNIAACTIFAACSGSSTASAASIGKMAYADLAKRGYHKAMLVGSIAAGGTLGILIPPSIPMIIYGALTDNSVGRLYMGGVFPGLLMSALFMLYIGIRSWVYKLDPAEITEKIPFKKRLFALRHLWQAVLLIVAVLGSIYGGIATPTEAASLGAAMSLIFVAVERRLSFDVLRHSLLATVQTVSMIMFIVIGARIISETMIFYNVSQTLVALVKSYNITPITLMVIVIIFYIILGCFFDALSMMVLTLPFVIPLIYNAGFDGVWFGILFTVLIEIGLLTPPFGINLFVLQGVTGEPLGLVAKGSFPFILIQCLILIILIVWPSLALWLPNRLIGGS